MSRVCCRVCSPRSRSRVVQGVLPGLLAALAQQGHGQVRAVDRNVRLDQGRVAGQVVHVEAVVDGHQLALAEAGARPSERETRGLGTVGRAGEHQCSIGHLDQ
jgi:hypothetical protein